MSNRHHISVRFSGLTWRTARVSGVIASCTESPAAAAKALACKLWGAGAHKVECTFQGSSTHPATYLIEKDLTS